MENQNKLTREEKYDGFLEFLATKLDIKLDNITYIGSGVDGEVHNIGNGRVLKIGSSNYKESIKLMNKNIEGLCKIYSIGRVKVPQRFMTKTHNRHGLFLKSAILSTYGKTIETNYTIMEKLESKKAKSDLDFYINGVIESYFNQNNDKKDVYGAFDYEYKMMNGVYIVNVNRKSDDFLIELIEYANNSYFQKQSECEKFYELISDLLKIFKNVSKYFKWEDIHKGQFGYDKKGDLKAFDIDSSYNVELDYDYSKPKHVVMENVMTFEQYNNPIIIDINDIKLEQEIILVDTKNVHKIIEVSKSGKMPLDKLRVETISQKIKDGIKMPPLVLYRDNKLKDGHHRYAAYKMIGENNIEILYI